MSAQYRTFLDIDDLTIGETVRIIGTTFTGIVAKKYMYKIEVSANGRTHEVYPAEVERVFPVQS